MARGIKLYVWGDYALFTRPEMKVERVSYDVMTPSAARNILQSIYWKPQMKWVVDAIHVLKPIVFTSVRRNEVSAVVTVSESAIKNALNTNDPVDCMGFDPSEVRQQRASLVLKNVAYIIEAHFDVLEYTFEKNGPKMSEADCAAKHFSMFTRRAAEGQAFQQPYFGCREFPANFRLIADGETLPDCELPESQLNKDLGFMLHDFIYREDKKGKVVSSNDGKKYSAEACFFRAQLVNGIVKVPTLNSEEVKS